jgi:hypothetical protein
MSRIIPAFCSSVRPAAMLTVISGIGCSLFVFFVMAGLVPAIHVLLQDLITKTWMPGTSPGMTA